MQNGELIDELPLNTQIHIQNQNSWNMIADDWFGTTALPIYGCNVPNENLALYRS